MTREVVALLAPQRGGLFLDCTVGAGGHSLALLRAGASRLIGLDRDPTALVLAAKALGDVRDRAELVHADFRDFDAVLDARGITAIDGALADLGLSSVQLETPGRGFSFRRDEPLDMRMDPTAPRTAADLIQEASESELARVIHEYGEERHSRRIARALVRARATEPIRTTVQLADLTRRAIPRGKWQRIDPATRTFQALRIWVNAELEGLERFLTNLLRRLATGARAAVMAFHSLEDRIVKRTFRALEHADGAAARILTKKPIAASDEEVARNPRARSAKLRAIERMA